MRRERWFLHGVLANRIRYEAYSVVTTSEIDTVQSSMKTYVFAGVLLAVTAFVFGAESLDNDARNLPAKSKMTNEKSSEGTPLSVSAKSFKAPNTWRISLVLKPGDTLLKALTSVGISHSQAYAASDSLKSLMDLRTLKPAQTIWLDIQAQNNNERRRTLNKLSFVAKTDRLFVTRRTNLGSYDARSEKLRHFRSLKFVSGRIENSFYLAAKANDIPTSVLLEIFAVLGRSIDFQRDIQKGDKFFVGYESFTDGIYGGQHPGNLIYISLSQDERATSFFRYTTSDGYVDFFDTNGKSIQTNLIVTPIDGGRLSSLYGTRDHPVLGYERMHKGLDFAAPKGTPVLAAGDGIITQQAHKKTFGKYVRIRHNRGYSTAYAHLSKFVSEFTLGSRVRQGDVIGFVGSTGLTSGPNLHYEVLKNGNQVNPVTVDLPAHRVLSGEEFARFKKMHNKTLAEMKLKTAGYQNQKLRSYSELGAENG